jgi:DNA-binding beta-propeller fold protein YncE
VAAKSFLFGSVVVSPDGTRVYAIGIKQGIDEDDLSGSAGVFVFDPASMTAIGAWRPTADYVSIAVSRDGRYLYAAGLPSVDALGRRRPEQKASITVFDTRDGSVRLIAGALDGDLITFLTPTLG